MNDKKGDGRNVHGRPDVAIQVNPENRIVKHGTASESPNPRDSPSFRLHVGEVDTYAAYEQSQKNIVFVWHVQQRQ